MPVLTSPEIAKKFKEKWMLLHPEDQEDAGGAVSFDDSLTSLHWLQNFSIMSAAPDRAPGFGWRPQQLVHPPGGTESPSSPPAGDTAASGTAHTPGNPAASCSKLAAASACTPVYGHSGAQSHEEVDYKTNPHVKPPYSYATLICMAMQASKKTKITLSAIYSWITENFCYYRHAEPSWQNSIRHNLSLNKCFMKVPRQKDEPGKGGFWQIDPQYADMFVNGVFKRRRMPATNFSTQRQNRILSTCSSYSPQRNTQTGMNHYQEPVAGSKRKQACPKRAGKLGRMSQSPLLASEIKTSDVLRGDFDLASVFDDVLSGNGSTFEDLDINTALSSLGCEIEVSAQNQHVSTVSKWYSNEDEQACAYLEMNSMMGCSIEDFQCQQQQQPQQQQIQTHQQYYEGLALFSDLPQQQQPWEIKEEAQAIPLSLDQGYGLCEGFFSEMPMWERGEVFP